MKIETIKCLKDNYSYLIIDETNRNACVIDPSEALPIINFIVFLLDLFQLVATFIYPRV